MHDIDYTVIKGEFEINGVKVPWRKNPMGNFALDVGPLECIFFEGQPTQDRAADMLAGYRAGIEIGERRGVAKLQNAFRNLMHL